jgi:hypothetical protein
MMDTIRAEDAVANGMGRLDVYAEDGWDRYVLIPAISISSCELCMCGQVFGDYDTGIRTLDLTHADAPLFGFVQTSNIIGDLDTEWKKAIRARRAMREAEEAVIKEAEAALAEDMALAVS